MPGAVLDIEQALLLLELEPPFEQRDVQLARRRLAKVWHPDLAPPGRQFEHERHLKAINEAADQLISLAEGSRGGRVSKNAVRASAAAARVARQEAGRRAYEEEQRQRAADADRAKHDPFASRMPDHSVVHRYARCVSYPEWGVGTVAGIYFTGAGDDVQQWARVKFAVGVRTVPAGSLQFVDFSTPDPGAERVAALPDRGPARDGRGRLRAGRAAARLRARRRAAQPVRAAAHDARLLAGGEPRRGGPRRARLGARRRRAPGAAPLRRADLRGHGRHRPRRRGRRPRRGAGPGRRGRVGARRSPAPAAHGPRRGDRGARARAPPRADGRGAARPRARPPPRGRPRRGGHRDRAGDDARRLDRRRPGRATRFALARTDRVSDAIAAAERALRLAADPEVADLLERLRAAQPRVLPAA